MTNKGLGDEYALVYGTALGALRNHTILAHTEDIDIGLSVHAAQILSQNSTRLELWAAGYAFWYGDFFRMCPHIWHPSLDFRARMEPVTHQQWVAQNKVVAPVYMDAYLMWPKNSSSKSWDKLDFRGYTVAAATAYLNRMHTLKGQNHRGSAQAQQDASQSQSQSGNSSEASVNTTRSPTWENSTQATGSTTPQPSSDTTEAASSTVRQQSIPDDDTTEGTEQGAASSAVEPSGRVTDYCLWGSLLPISLQEGARPLEVDGSRFPAPINIKE